MFPHDAGPFHGIPELSSLCPRFRFQRDCLIKLLTFTTLYPDSTRPTHGIFVENRLRHLVAAGKVASRVVAPVPWFPLKRSIFGSYTKYASVPRKEVWHGIDVEHPRYPLVPKIGMTAAPWLMAAALKLVLSRIIEDGYDFDIIDAHYFYPDGVAAVMLGRALDKPVVITARGTDLNLIPRYYFPRRMIQRAARDCAAIITVCQALKSKLTQLGVADTKVTVLRNGVDLTLFMPPTDRQTLRKRLELTNKTLLSVGNLVPLKGHDISIASLRHLPGHSLMIAGEGPEREKLQKLAARIGVGERVRFLGRVKHEGLPEYYGAADALVLASSREGWANVLLESLACGTPVIATGTGGSPEIISTPEAGVLIDDRSDQGLSQGVELLFSSYPDRTATRNFAEQFSWDATTAGQERLFAQVLASRSVDAVCTNH